MHSNSCHVSDFDALEGSLCWGIPTASQWQGRITQRKHCIVISKSQQGRQSYRDLNSSSAYSVLVYV